MKNRWIAALLVLIIVVSACASTTGCSSTISKKEMGTDDTIYTSSTEAGKPSAEPSTEPSMQQSAKEFKKPTAKQIKTSESLSGISEPTESETEALPSTINPSVTESSETETIETKLTEAEPIKTEPVGTEYVLNTNSKKFHYPSCGSVAKMKESNKEYYTGTREELIAMGYEPCKNCDP